MVKRAEDSLFLVPGGKTWRYDFQRGGRRFAGDTLAATKAEARTVVRRVEEEADEWARESRAAKAVGRGVVRMTIGQAADRYWTEVAMHQVMAAQLRGMLQGAVDYFGKNKHLDEIGDTDVAAWVAARRGERRWGRAKNKQGRPEKLLAPRTVNLTTVDILQPLFRRAKEVWKQTLPFEPDWQSHRLKVQKNAAIRVLNFSNEDRIAEKLPAGYRDIWRLSLASGLRLAECFLRWDQIDWEARTITVTLKGGRRHTIPLTNQMAAIISAAPKAHEEWVFTYVCVLTRHEPNTDALYIKGERYPVTYGGMQTKWRRMVQVGPTALGIETRFHDMRHTRATRLLRDSGNLKAVQNLLGHRRITTTAETYAHFDNNDVRAALEASDARARKSHKKSHGQVEMDLKPLTEKGK